VLHNSVALTITFTYYLLNLQFNIVLFYKFIYHFASTLCTYNFVIIVKKPNIIVNTVGQHSIVYVILVFFIKLLLFEVLQVFHSSVIVFLGLYAHDPGCTPRQESNQRHIRA